MALAAVGNAEVAGKAKRELTDDEVLAVLTKEAKKRAESAEAFAAQQPLGRLIEPEEVADAVLFFLAGPEFVTGQVLAVDEKEVRRAAREAAARVWSRMQQNGGG